MLSYEMETDNMELLFTIISVVSGLCGIYEMVTKDSVGVAVTLFFLTFFLLFVAASKDSPKKENNDNNQNESNKRIGLLKGLTWLTVLILAVLLLTGHFWSSLEEIIEWIIPRPPVSVNIDVYQYDTTTKKKLNSWTETISVGNNIISTRDTPSGYRLVDQSGKTVSVDRDGNSSVTTVGFGYEKIKVSIYVYQYDINTRVTISGWYEDAEVGNYTIRSGSTPSGYKLADQASKIIYVDNDGNPSETSVGFGYERTNVNVRVYQYDINTGVVLSDQYQNVSVGNHTFRAGSAPSGYILDDDSSKTVYVDNDEVSVGFGYKKKEQPTLPPMPKSSEIKPTSWTTQFVYSEKNKKAANSLSKIADNNISTSFYYTIWQSEREDSSPEITAFFNNETISKIGIVNGKVTSQNEYSERARANHITARIYTSSGIYETIISVPDKYTQQYQQFSLGGTYYDVIQIELFLSDYYKGHGKEQYEMNISEMKFYN